MRGTNTRGASQETQRKREVTPDWHCSCSCNLACKHEKEMATTLQTRRRSRDSGRAEACRSTRRSAHDCASESPVRSQLHLVHFASRALPCQCPSLTDGSQQAAAHTNFIQGWFPAVLPVTDTPWPADAVCTAGLLSMCDITITWARTSAGGPPTALATGPTLLVKAQQALRSSSRLLALSIRSRG
jgi:hypothetical protein